MPVTKKKPINYKCRTCGLILTEKDVTVLRDKGFEHQKEKHDLVEENRSWFNSGHHWNYFIVT